MSQFNLRIRRLYRFLRRWIFPIVGIFISMSSIIHAVLALFFSSGGRSKA